MGGGRIEVAICDRAGKVDRTAWSWPQRHHNQQGYLEAGAGTAGGWRGGVVFLRGFWSECGVGDILDVFFFVLYRTLEY